MNISNTLTFIVKTFQISLSMKSKLKVKSSGPKRIDSERKILLCLCAFLIAHLISTVQLNGTDGFLFFQCKTALNVNFTVASHCSMLTICKQQIVLI